MEPAKMMMTCDPRNRAESVDIWKARQFIDNHSDEQLSLKQVARAVNMSPNYLSEKFKQVTGMNFVKYIARMRYEKARALLQNVDLRISEIAFATGFQSLSQFNRVFKKLSGKSPTEYRAALRIGRTTAPMKCEIGEFQPSHFTRKNA